MGVTTSHEQPIWYEPAAVAIAENGHLLYDQPTSLRSSAKKRTSNKLPGKIVEYRTGSESSSGFERDKKVNRILVAEGSIGAPQNQLDRELVYNSSECSCRKLLIGDSGPFRPFHADKPVLLQSKQVHRLYDMRTLSPIEDHEQLSQVLSRLPGFVCDVSGWETEFGWKEYKFNTKSQKSPVGLRCLPWPDLLESSPDRLQSFVDQVNKIQRMQILRVWAWTIYLNPLHTPGRLAVILPPRTQKRFRNPVFPDKCKQEMFAMEIRELPSACNLGY